MRIFFYVILVLFFGIKKDNFTKLDVEIQKNAQFGWSVDISDAFCAVGSIMYKVTNGDSKEISGAVIIYKKINSVWKYHQKITAPNPKLTHSFGSSISLNGNDLIIGAPLEKLDINSVGSSDRAGAVFVYGFDNELDVFVLTNKIVKSTRNSLAGFGSTVQIEDSLGFITEQGRDGQISIIRKNNLGWQMINSILLSNFKGIAVSLDNNSIAYVNKQGVRDKDFPFVYDVVIEKLDSLGNSKAKQILTPKYRQKDLHFGSSGLKIKGDYCFVQSYYKIENANSNGVRGNVHVFKQISDVWVETDRISSPDMNPCDWFGMDISASDNMVIIGAMGDNYNVDGALKKYQGAAYLYEINDETGKLKLIRSIKNPNDREFVKFGFSIGIDNDNVIIGSRYEMGILGKDTIDKVGGAYLFKTN